MVFETDLLVIAPHEFIHCRPLEFLERYGDTT